jgi:hypothetical protein
MGKHLGLTMVRAVVTVESEGVRAELATCTRPKRRCSGAYKVASAHRWQGPCPNRGEHRKEQVRAVLRVQAIGKPSTLRALPPITGSAALLDRGEYFVKLSGQRARRECVRWGRLFHSLSYLMM